MRASVIVVAYNSRRHLPACLDSILADMGDDDELIVVDNSSTDGSAELVASRYPQARLLRAPNSGYAGGNNRGAAVARCEALLFLNPDTVILPGTLRALLAPLAARPETALTTACVVYMDRPNIVNACGNTMHYTGLTYCRGAGQPTELFAAPEEVDAVSGAAFAIRRAVFEELGGFDERFFMYCEDTDLSWRARLAGYCCLYVPDAVVRHDYRSNYSPSKAFYLDRNRHLMLLKCLRPATYVRMLPGLLLGEIITGGFLLLKGPRYWTVKPRVFQSLWLERARTRAARRETLQRRRIEHDVVQLMTHRLEFGQFVGSTLAAAAARVFHPAFWAARLLFALGRRSPCRGAS